MIRNENDFTLNGEAYVVSPHIEFQDYIEVTLRHKTLEGDESVFKYHDHDAVLESCNSKIISSESYEVGIEGGQIDLDNELILFIPSDALAENVNITLSFYNLIDCYDVGANEIFVGGNHTVDGSEVPKKLEIDYRVIIISVTLLVFIFLTIVYLNKFKKLKKKKKS